MNRQMTLGRLLGFFLLIIALGSIFGCGNGSSIAGGSSNKSRLNAFNGRYAFLLTGFDLGGTPMAVAGTITADGSGHITNGAVDVNDGAVVSSAAAVTGTYTLGSNFRGIITFTDTVGSVTHPFAFAFTMKANGTSAAIIGFDENLFVISGTIQKQDQTAFSLAALAGDFAFETDSNMGGRISHIGRFTLGTNGATTNAIDDASLAGQDPLLTDNSFSAQYEAPASNGRGTATVTESGVTRSFAYYVISASNFIAMEIDPSSSGLSTTLGTMVATRQSTPFLAETVNTAGSVFAMTGLDAYMNYSIAVVGTLQVTGSNTGNLLWDSNDAGSVSGPISSSNNVVTFDPTTGRGTLTVPNGFADGLFSSAIFYLTGTGTGYILDAGTRPNNRALAGSFQPQTGIGTFATASISTNMIAVSASGNTHFNDLAEDVLFTPNTTTHALSGVGDYSGSSLITQDLIVSGVTYDSVDATSGRGTWKTLAGVTFVCYLIAPNHLVLRLATNGHPAFLYFVTPQ
jgi:hypothetical protein